MLSQYAAESTIEGGGLSLDNGVCPPQVEGSYQFVVCSFSTWVVAIQEFAESVYPRFSHLSGMLILPISSAI